MKKVLTSLQVKFWLFIWELFEDLYKFTGLRWQAPIEYFYPDFCQWMFEKIAGCSGTRIDGKHLDIAIANETDEKELESLQKIKNGRILRGEE